MKSKICALILGALSFSGLALAATGTGSISYTRPSTYTDGSALAASSISGYSVDCVLTPTGGTATSCTTANLPGGTASSGAFSVTYPPQGARVCFRIRAIANGVTGEASNETCKDLAPLTPSAPTNVVITVTVALTITTAPDGSTRVADAKAVTTLPQVER